MLKLMEGELSEYAKTDKREMSGCAKTDGREM